MHIALGRYIAYNSVIHRMDPRLKLVMLIILIASIFFPVGYSGYLILAIIIFAIYFLAKLRVKTLITLAKPILFMVVILFLVNCFLVKGENASSWAALGWHWGGNAGGVKWFVVSEKSIYQALYMGIRIYLMITITTILTATTQPLDLTLALEDILSPLRLVRFPVHILSTIISIALRMIPTLIEEAGRIMKAQASRGIDFKNGKFKDKVKSSVSLIIPLLVSAFQKAEDLAYAMDARGYDPKSHRTRYRKYKLQWIDFVIFFIMAGIGIVVIVQVYVHMIPTPWISYLDNFIRL